MKKRLLVLLALIMSILLVGCGGSSSGSDVKHALNDASTFSQEDINYVNKYIEEMKKDGATITSTVNSTTMQFSSTYTYKDEDTGKDVTRSFSTKLEKKNGIVVRTSTYTYTSTDSNSSYSFVDYELTIPRVFGEYTNNDFFTEAEKDGLPTLLSEDGLIGFDTDYSSIDYSNINALSISLGSFPDYSYKGTIVKYNNKYFLLDSTGVVASKNTLEALIANTNVKAKLQAELNKIN